MEEKTNCQFCEKLRKFKDDFEYYASRRPSMKEDCSTQITVSMVDNHYYRGEYSGRAAFDMGMPKYCPFCARPIGKEELEW